MALYQFLYQYIYDVAIGQPVTATFHCVAFLQTFAHTLEMQVKDLDQSEIGARIPQKDLDLMSDEQLLQLNELYNETTKPPST